MNNNEILSLLEAEYHDRRSALNFTNPFELLIATILSAQTNDNQVNKVTAQLFKKYNTPRDYAGLAPEQLEKDIKSIGLYHNKSRNIIAACRLLEDKFGGIVPQTRDELTQLPGVGRKTANVVLAFGFGQAAFPVDTHVFRVSNRLGLTHSRSPEESERQLMQIVPEDKWSQAHHWLIWHGREVCSARKPQCEICKLADCCENNMLKTK